jgi:hypothetical protein
MQAAGVGDGRLAHACKGNFNFRGWQLPLHPQKWSMVNSLAIVWRRC